jgi:hypothetical protein
MRSTLWVYPICTDDTTVVAFVEFVQTHGSSLLQAARGPRAPRVYVSLIEGLRSPMMRTNYATWVFWLVNQINKQDNAKHYFTGFTIQFTKQHSFTDSSRGSEILPPQDYQGLFHWHDGQRHMNIDAWSITTSDGSRHPRFSADYAYQSLPTIMGQILQAWTASHGNAETITIPESLILAPKHDLARPAFLSFSCSLSPSFPHMGESANPMASPPPWAK